MSNSIWHKASEKPELNKYVVVRKHGFAQWKVFKFDNETTFYEPFTDDLWAYVADIMFQADKAERLQKAVDYALHVLDDVIEIGGIDLEIIKIKQMIKDN